MDLKNFLGAIAMVAAYAVSANAAELPSYNKVSGVSGNVNSVGSDTLANLMTFWAEEFRKQYPNVNIGIQAAGSSTAPPALTCLLYTSPSPRDVEESRMPSSA